LICCRFLR